MEEECTGHLATIAREVAYAATFEDGEHAHEPDAGAEEFHESAFAESECAVELALGVGYARDIAMGCEVFEFLAAAEHVDEDESGIVRCGGVFDFFEAAEDLAGEGAAEVSQENEGDDLVLGGVPEGFAGCEQEVAGCFRGVGSRGWRGCRHLAADEAAVSGTGGHGKRVMRKSDRASVGGDLKCT